MKTIIVLRSVFACAVLAAACNAKVIDDETGDLGPDDLPLPPGPVVHPPPWSTLPPRCNTDAWCWLDPYPFGDAILGLSASQSTNVWLVGGHGLIVHFDGAAWSYVDCGSYGRIYAASSTSPTEAWFVGEEGSFHWDGTTCTHPWHPIEEQTYAIGSGLPTFGVWGSGPRNVFASDGRAVWQFNGTDWKSLPLPSQFPGALFSGSARHDVWLFGGPVPLHRTGTEWTPVRWSGDEYVPGKYTRAPSAGQGTARRPDSVWALFGTAGGDLSDARTRSVAQRFDGTAFRVASPPLPARFHGSLITSAAPDDVWVDGMWDGRERDLVHLEGGTWVSQQLSDVRLLSLAATATHDVWGLDGGFGEENVLHYDGTAWTTYARTRAARGLSLAVGGTGPSDVWLSSSDEVVHYDGTTFRTFAMEDRARSVWSASRTAAWVVGEKGIWHWNGTTWARQSGVSGHAVSGSSATDVWSVGGGRVMHFDGMSWTDVSPQTPVRHPLWVASPTDVWAGGAGSSSLAHWDGQAWTQRAALPVGSLIQIWGSGPNDVWVVGTTGVMRFDGVSWQRPLKLNPCQVPESVTGTGPDDVTVSIDSFCARPPAVEPNILHWDGEAWTGTTVPFPTKVVWAAARGETWTIAEGGVMRRRAN